MVLRLAILIYAGTLLPGLVPLYKSCLIAEASELHFAACAQAMWNLSRCAIQVRRGRRLDAEKRRDDVLQPESRAGLKVSRGNFCVIPLQMFQMPHKETVR